MFLGATLAGTRAATGADEDVIRAAIARSVPLLQSSAQTWIEKRACVSCHHQALGALAVSAARTRGFRVDEALVDAQLSRMHPAEPRDLLVGDGGINGQFGRSYMLVGLAGAGVPPSPVTDVMAHFVAGKQAADGRWPSLSHRPPLEDSEVAVTALAIRALEAYGAAGRADETRRRIARASAWLEAAPVRTNEDRTFRLLGLSWSGAPAAATSGAAGALRSAQRFDGGWAQLETRGSDAYATGQALVALNQAGGVPGTDPLYGRGIAYLLRTQRPDGTWRVDTRRRGEGLPYFETGFPHGEDQFISYAASAWATIALAIALPGPPLDVFAVAPASRPIRRVEPQARIALPPLHAAVLFGSPDELRARLDAGDDPDAALGDTGITPLMCAVHDPARVRLLLERGARPDARSAEGHSALLLAAGYDGSRESVRLLLERGADPRAKGASGLTPIMAAAESADAAKIDLLLAAGASLEEGAPEATPLLIATFQRDPALLRRLADRGADTGLGALLAASNDGSTEAVRALIDVGAPVDESEDDGTMALHWAAAADPGHTQIVEALVAAGADPNARTLDGRTPLSEAERFGNWAIADRLRAAGARCDE